MAGGGGRVSGDNHGAPKQRRCWISLAAIANGGIHADQPPTRGKPKNQVRLITCQKFVPATFGLKSNRLTNFAGRIWWGSFSVEEGRHSAPPAPLRASLGGKQRKPGVVPPHSDQYPPAVDPATSRGLSWGEARWERSKMAARAAGAGGNYDYLVKLLLIGDSGAHTSGPTLSSPSDSSAPESPEPVSTPTPHPPLSAGAAWLLRRGSAAGQRRAPTTELPRRFGISIACSLKIRAIPPSHRAQRTVLNSKLREQGLARVASFCDFPTTHSPPASSRPSESTSRSEPSSKRVSPERPRNAFIPPGASPSGRLMRFRGPWSLGNLNLVDDFPPGSQAFQANS